MISDYYMQPGGQHHPDIFLILDEVPCNSDSVPKFVWGGPSGDWRGLKTNGVNVMMALTPIEEPFSRGLFRMFLDFYLSKHQGVDIQLPENLSQLKLGRVYRCTQNMLKFQKQVAENNNTSLFAYSKLNSSSCSYSPGHEIIGNKPDLVILPSCGCFYACDDPLEHLFIKYREKIFTTLKSVSSTSARENKITIVIATAKKSLLCVEWVKAELKNHDFEKDFDVKTIDQCRGNEYETLVTVSNPPNSRGGHLPWWQERCFQNHQCGRPAYTLLDLFTRVTTSLFIIHMNDKFYSRHDRKWCHDLIHGLY